MSSLSEEMLFPVRLANPPEYTDQASLSPLPVPNRQPPFYQKGKVGSLGVSPGVLKCFFLTFYFKITIYSQEAAKIVQRSLVYPSPSFSSGYLRLSLLHLEKIMKFCCFVFLLKLETPKNFFFTLFVHWKKIYYTWNCLIQEIGTNC